MKTCFDKVSKFLQECCDRGITSYYIARDSGDFCLHIIDRKIGLDSCMTGGNLGRLVDCQYRALEKIKGNYQPDDTDLEDML